MEVRQESYCSSDDDIEEEIHSKENVLVTPKKKRGRKAQWIDSHIADMVDVICSDDYFSRKLISPTPKTPRTTKCIIKCNRKSRSDTLDQVLSPKRLHKCTQNLTSVLPSAKNLLWLSKRRLVLKGSKMNVVMGTGSISYLPQ